MTRTRIGIIFGGASEEHPVSLKSVREVAANLDLETYEPAWIGITETGEWYLCDGPELGSAARRRCALSPDRGVRGLLVEDSGRWEAVPLDVVFPVLHGTSGEDGAIQGLLELSGIPYVGCDVASSAICMDKSLAYVIAASAGIRTPRFRTVDARDPLDAYDTGQIGYPAFVKPARSGSSFGVSKVERAEDLAGAVQCARGYDSKVLIEEAVVGSEVGCAVLGEGPDVIVGEVDRIALSHGFFRIHQEDAPELGSHNSTPIVPADISPEQRTLVQRTARAIYAAFGCRGLARVDMFLTADGDVVLNEVNTLPGLTSYSRYPRMMAAADLPLRAVIDRLVALAQAGRRR